MGGPAVRRRRRFGRGGGLSTVARDSILFLSGIILIVNELVVRDGPERPTVLLLLAGMVGLPAFLRADERASQDDADE